MSYYLYVLNSHHHILSNDNEVSVELFGAYLYGDHLLSILPLSKKMLKRAGYLTFSLNIH